MSELYRRQAQGAAVIFHPGVAPLYDFGEISLDEAGSSQGAMLAGDVFWVSTPLEGGQPLQGCMERLEWPQFRRVLLGVLEALAFGHARGVVHRRLSPELVWVALSPGREDVEAVQLLEFGLLPPRRLDGLEVASSGYQAPEVVEGRWREQGAWSDLYSVGVMAFRWLYGRMPDDEQGRPTRGEQHHFVPSGFASWVLSCLDESPIDRFRFAADAHEHLSRLDVHFWGPKQPEKRRPPSWRRDGEVDWDAFRELWRSSELYRFREVPLVGRTEVRDGLWRALMELHEGGRARVVVVRGPSGVGKTRLVEWLTRRAHELGLADVMRASHHAVANSADGLTRMLARYFRATGLSVEGAERRVYEELSGRGLDELQARASAQALAAWMLPWGERAQAQASAERSAAMQLAFNELSRERPLIVCVEDGQWASETLDWVEGLLDSPVRASVLVVITVNDEALVDRPLERVQLDQLLEKSSVSELVVPPLTLHEQLSFISLLAPLEEELAYELAQRAGGNPLFIVRVLKRWVHEDLLVPSERDPERLTVGEAERERLPEGMLESWDGAVEQLIEQFDDEVRQAALQAMEIAAALGLTVLTEEWEDVCERCEVRLPDHLLAALFANCLASELYEERSFEFVHPMLRESLARRAMQEGRYKAIHRACADALAARYSEDDLTVAERLGVHLFEAGDNDRAMAHLLKGGTHAGNMGESRRALGLIARYDQACDRLELDARDVRRVRGMLRQCWALHAAGQVDAAQPVIEQARQLLREEDEAELLVPLIWLDAGLNFTHGNLEQVEVLLGEARRVSELHSDRHGLAGTLLRLGSTWKEKGNYEKAVDAYEQARQLWAQARELGGQAAATLGLVSACLESGELLRARALLDEVRDEEELFERVSGGDYYNAYGELCRREERWEEAEVMYRRSIASWEAVGGVDANLVRCNLGMMMVTQGRYGEAMELLGDVESAWSRAGMVREQVYTLAAMMPCLAASSSWAVWREYAVTVEGYVREKGMRSRDLREMFEINAELAEAAGDGEVVALSRKILQTQCESVGEGVVS
ncbi:hypothetical protein DL240_08225 [Lujinxingia litoralis]|uniref:Protein kinase domain-containing protein n=1 Tax=Lujinxingia litoralis TaxID=2211119 RepID=A0A328C5U7_9DELT|nr:AAA family ATPase [Lujinxingia litoralis]RAL22869.1 hypothetical protein DL240_08225 [Lujinxingia litoralis]